MGCGRKAYDRIKERKGYERFIIALAAGDGTYWTYNDDANTLKSEIYEFHGSNGYSQSSFHFGEKDLRGKYSLVHLTGDAYKVQPKNQMGHKYGGKQELNIDERSISTDKQNTYTSRKKNPTKSAGNASIAHIPVYVPEPPIERSCENCFHYISNTCTIVRKELCEDYSAAPPATREEKENRRSMGDASGIAQGIPWYKR